MGEEVQKRAPERFRGYVPFIADPSSSNEGDGDPEDSVPAPPFPVSPLTLEELPTGNDPLPCNWLGPKFKKWHPGTIPIFADLLLSQGYLPGFAEHRQQVITNLQAFQAATMEPRCPSSPHCHRVVGACICHLMGAPRERWPNKYKDIKLSEFMPRVVPTVPAQPVSEPAGSSDTAATLEATSVHEMRTRITHLLEGVCQEKMTPSMAATPLPAAADQFTTLQTALDEDPEAALASIFDLIMRRFSGTSTLEAKVYELEHQTPEPVVTTADPEEIIRLSQQVEKLERDLAQSNTAKENALSTARRANHAAETAMNGSKQLRDEITGLKARIIGLGGSLTDGPGKPGGKDAKDAVKVPSEYADAVLEWLGPLDDSAESSERKRLVVSALAVIKAIRDCKPQFEAASVRQGHSAAQIDRLIEEVVIRNLVTLMQGLVRQFDPDSKTRKSK